MKGQKLQKKMTKAEKEYFKKKNEEAVEFQKGYQEIVEKHQMQFRAGLFLNNEIGMIAPGVNVVNLDKDNAKNPKDRIKAFHDEYKEFEEKGNLALSATIFTDDTTNEVRAKMEIIPKPKQKK